MAPKSQKRLGLRARLQCEQLESRQMLAAELVYDFNTNPADGLNQVPLTKVGNAVYFGSNGKSWKTDGTPAGTAPISRTPVGALGDKLLFFENGQLLVGTNHDGPLTVLASNAGEFFRESPIFNGNYYFRVEQDYDDYEMWRTNGTVAGTVPVKDVWPEQGDFIAHQFTPAGNWLYFVTIDSQIGRELWRTNGTEAGTQRITDLNPSVPDRGPDSLTAAGSTLYYVADDGVDPHALWKVVGAGTPVKLVDSHVDIGSLTAVGTQLFFSQAAADDENPTSRDRRELRKTDGTGSGTKLVRSFPGADDYYFDTFFQSQFVAIGNTLYFVAFDKDHGWELWRSNGTTAGTVAISDVSYDGVSIPLFGTVPSQLTRVGNELFFLDGISDIWRSNGTPDGTVKIATLDYLMYEDESLPDEFVALGHKLLFTAYSDAAGLELFASDGTTAGTRLIKDTRPGTTSSRADTLVVAGDRLYLNADQYVVDLFSNGTENSLWETDGTATGTKFVADPNPARSSGASGVMARLGNYLYFHADFALYGERIWRTDGSSTEAQHVRYSTDNEYENLEAREMLKIGSKLYIATTTRQLFATDGSTVWLDLLANMSVSNLTQVGDKLLFAGTDDSGVTGLWRSNGTASGTVLVKQVVPQFLTHSNGRAYFLVDGKQLWTSDGTAGGTVLLKELPNIYSMVDMGSSLWFTARDDEYNRAIWKTNGTLSGTSMVVDALPSIPGNLTRVGTTLFFTVGAWPSPTQLWKSDGTSEGTTSLATISGASNFTAVGNRLMFVAYESEHGMELWQSDGTESGTRLFDDILAGAAGAYPDDLVAFRNQLYFTADDGFYGRELWRVDPNPPKVLDVVNISPDPRSNAVTSVDVTLSKSVVLSSFTFADLHLTRNGTEVPLNNTVSITSLGEGRYRISGLGSFTSLGGSYELRVRSVGLRDDQGQRGVGGAVDLWKTDTTNLGGTVTYVEGTAVLVAAAASLNNDPDFEFDGAQLKLSLSAQATETDRLRIRTSGVVSASGGKVFINSVQVATYSGGANGSPLVITFDTAASRGRVETVLKKVEFLNTSQAPLEGARTLTVAVSNSANVTLTSKRKSIQVEAVNDAPVIRNFGAGVTYTENGSAVAIAASNASISDVDAASFGDGRLIADIVSGAQSDDRLMIRTTSRLTTNSSRQVFLDGQLIGSYAGGVGTTALVVSFTADCNPAGAGVVMRNIVYSSATKNSSDVPRMVSMQVFDGLPEGDSAVVSKSLTVVPVNDPPVLGNISNTSYQLNADPIRLAEYATVRDFDSYNLDRAVLKIEVTQGASSSNFIDLDGTFFKVSGNRLLRGSVGIGTVNNNAGQGLSKFEVTFNAEAITPYVQQFIRVIRFSTRGGTTAFDRTIAYTFTEQDSVASTTHLQRIHVS